MSEWIHVITDTKIPDVRDGKKSPFEEFDFDPNVAGYNYGPDQPSMFLPVIRNTEPVVNPVLEKVILHETVGTKGVKWAGKYVNPNWVVDWDVEEQDLQTSKYWKYQQLNQAKNVATNSGYVVGPYEFPYFEDFFRLLSNRHYWMELAIADGTIQPDHTVTFSDLNGLKVQVTFAQIENHFTNYGNAFISIEETEVQARDDISNATTVAEVDAVTWSF